MGKRFSAWVYRMIYAAVLLCTPKMQIEGAEPIFGSIDRRGRSIFPKGTPEGTPPQEPVIVVGNHSQLYGPITAEVYLPKCCTIWCAGEMMNTRECPAYAYRDFWSGKPKWQHWFWHIASYAITPLAACLFTNARTIAVYHDTRLLTTYRESVQQMQQGRSLVIFPEHYTKWNNIVYDFQDKFVDLARFYYKKTGQAVRFVPLYTAPRLARARMGEPIRFDPAAPIAEERRRICTYLKQQITEMAASMPEHTVVPYPNIPKKLYPKNLPVTDYTEEQET